MSSSLPMRRVKVEGGNRLFRGGWENDRDSKFNPRAVESAVSSGMERYFSIFYLFLFPFSIFIWFLIFEKTRTQTNVQAKLVLNWVQSEPLG